MTVLKTVFVVIFALLWIYFLSVCHRAKLPGWYFVIGVVGSFFLLSIVFSGPLLDTVASVVSFPARLLGDLTEKYTAILGNGKLYLIFAKETVTFYTDADGSGFTELCIFISTVMFFKPYSVRERAFMMVIGGFAVILSTSFRILTVCLLTVALGEGYFYAIHNIVGRVIFFALNVVLYYSIFTRVHVKRIGIGSFDYAFTQSVE